MEDTKNDLNGVNLIGYSRAAMGIGESCRLAANSFQKSNIPFGIINFTKGNSAATNDLSWKEKEIDSPVFRTNIFHINADQMPVVYQELGQALFKDRYNIGYWHWELPEFPDDWLNSFKLIDEVWVPSTFVYDSIVNKSPIPVVKIPHGIQVDVPQNLTRSSFNLPENLFLFLSMYDVHSFQERKNPIGVINAYKTAFGSDHDQSVGLVLKVNNIKSNPIELKKLKRAVKGMNNVYIIDQTLGRNEINALINVCDSYISLHRSEGFGLPLAEAMYLGKPVIATNWSANTDFMTTENSCPVDYFLRKIGVNHGPYKAHQVWAEPNITQAASYMRKLVQDEGWRKTLALKGKNTIYENFSPTVIGKMVKKRLLELGLL